MLIKVIFDKISESKYFLINLLSKVLNALCVFFISLIVINIYGSAGLGDLATYQSLVGLVQPVFLFGLGGYVIKKGPMDNDDPDGFYTNIYLTFLLCSSIGFVLFKLIVFVFQGYFLAYNKFFDFFILGAISSAFILVCQSVFVVNKRYILLALSNFIPKLILLSVLIYLNYSDCDVSVDAFKLDFITSIMVSSVFLLLVLMIFFKKIKCESLYFFSKYFWLSNYNFVLIGLIHTFNSCFGIIVSFYFSSSNDVGELALALRFTAPIVLILSVVNNFTARDFRDCYESYDAKRVILRSSQITTKYFLYLFVAIIFIVISVYPMIALINIELTIFWWCFAVLVLGYIINIYYLASGNVLIICGDVKAERVIMSISLALNFIFVFSTITFLGVLSVAIGQALAMIAVNLLTDIYVRRKYKVSISPKFKSELACL